MPVSFSPALTSVLDLLRCPVCSACLHPAPGAVRCPAGHTFNLSRHGYVSLLTGERAISGDDAEMARARGSFLAGGKYDPIRRVVARLASDGAARASTVVDVGCGTGYYLGGVLDQLQDARGLGLDSSAPALRSAARAHPRGAAASWDVFRRFPLASRSADVVLDVFAPRNPCEFHRVLRAGGRLVVVRPASHHLIELRGHVPGMVSIDPEKENRLQTALDPSFEVVDAEQVEYAMPLARSEAHDLVRMTPSARHVDRSSSIGQALDHVTVSVVASAYRPR